MRDTDSIYIPFDRNGNTYSRTNRMPLVFEDSYHAKSKGFDNECLVEYAPVKKKDVEWVEEYPGSDNIICKGCGSLWNVLDNCTEDFVFCPKCGGKIVYHE